MLRLSLALTLFCGCAVPVVMQTWEYGDIRKTLERLSYIQLLQEMVADFSSWGIQDAPCSPFQA